MRNSQLNKIKMFDTVHSVIAQHQVTWINNAAFSAAFYEFSSKLDELKSLTAEHLNSSKGVTALKKVVLDKTVNHAMLIGNVIGAFALRIGDTELLMRNIYARSEWYKGNVLLKASRFKNLLSDAQLHEAALEEYGVDSASIQAFAVSVNEFETLTKQPRLSIVTKKQLTDKIVALMKELDVLLHGQLERILIVFISSDPRFYAMFKNACMIVDQKGKRAKVGNKKDIKGRVDGG